MTGFELDFTKKTADSGLNQRNVGRDLSDEDRVRSDEDRVRGGKDRVRGEKDRVRGDEDRVRGDRAPAACSCLLLLKLALPHPARHFRNRSLLAVHQHANAIDSRREPQQEHHRRKPNPE